MARVKAQAKQNRHLSDSEAAEKAPVSPAAKKKKKKKKKKKRRIAEGDELKVDASDTSKRIVKKKKKLKRSQDKEENNDWPISSARDAVENGSVSVRKRKKRKRKRMQDMDTDDIADPKKQEEEGIDKNTKIKTKKKKKRKKKRKKMKSATIEKDVKVTQKKDPEHDTPSSSHERNRSSTVNVDASPQPQPPAVSPLRGPSVVSQEKEKDPGGAAGGYTARQAEALKAWKAGFMEAKCPLCGHTQVGEENRFKFQKHCVRHPELRESKKLWTQTGIPGFLQREASKAIPFDRVQPWMKKLPFSEIEEHLLKTAQLKQRRREEEEVARKGRDDKDLTPAKGRRKAMEGKYTRRERELVDEGIEEWIQLSGVSREEALEQLFSREKQVKNAWSIIAAKVPGRNYRSVYNHAMRRYEPVKRGKWSEEETKQLVDLVEELGRDWARISKELNKGRMMCRDKYRQIRKNGKKKGNWTAAEDKQVVKAMRAVVPDEELGKKQRNIPWREITKMIPLRTRDDIMQRWYSVLQYHWRKLRKPTEEDDAKLYYHYPSDVDCKWTKKTDETILSAIQDSGVEEECDIEYSKLSPSLGYRRSKMRWQMLRRRVPPDVASKCEDFEDLVDWMVKNLDKLRSSDDKEK